MREKEKTREKALNPNQTRSISNYSHFSHDPKNWLRLLALSGFSGIAIMV